MESARVLFVQGPSWRSRGAGEEARALPRSLQIKAAPLTRYSLGVAQRGTGHLVEALASFQHIPGRAADADDTTPYVGPAREAVAALEGRIGRATIAVKPAEIDGVRWPWTGGRFARRLVRSSSWTWALYEIAASAPGFRAAVARFSVGAGSSVQVPIALV